jgi:hypothetical protein
MALWKNYIFINKDGDDIGKLLEFNLKNKGYNALFSYKD